MLYLNGKEWKDAEQFQKKILGSTPLKFTKNLVFVVADRYTGMRKMAKGGGEVKWTKSTAISAPMPIEYSTYIDGKSVVLRYVERVESRMETGAGGPVKMEIEHPGSLYIHQGKFEVKKHKTELWFFMMLSPYCENGFYTDLTPAEGNKANNVWGVSLKEVRDNIAARAVQPVYKYVDDTVIRKAKLNDENKRFEAEKLVRGASEQDLRDMYAALGQPESQTEDVDAITLWLLDKVKQPAIANQMKSGAEQVLNVDKKTVSFKAIVMRAEEDGIIRYAKAGRAWKFEGEEKEVICLVPSGVNPTDHLVEFLRGKDDGGQVLEKIKELTKALPA